jgi:uncharacterized membrane protein
VADGPRGDGEEAARRACRASLSVVRQAPNRARLSLYERPLRRSPMHPISRQPIPITHPALLAFAKERQKSIEDRIADRITAFSGSMRFVYLHAIWFAAWIGFGVESYPYGLLTMIVSLEAIFLSTFVLISQNRADAKREVVANQQWETVQEEDRQNDELLRLSHEILELTRDLHSKAPPPGGANGAASASERT